MSESNTLEVEVKFLLPDLQPLRQRLLTAGAALTKPRQFERNVRFDTQTETLRLEEKLLRLRQDDRARLTFKGPVLEDAASEAKVREELEVEVGDFHRTATILHRLGFLPLQIYEKYRETFTLDGVEVVLDELPFGNFAELEGDEHAIRTLSARLELPWSDRILDNYLNLMSRVKAHYNLPFDDLTFTNFDGLAIDLPAVLGT